MSLRVRPLALHARSVRNEQPLSGHCWLFTHHSERTRTASNATSRLVSSLGAALVVFTTPFQAFSAEFSAASQRPVEVAEIAGFLGIGDSDDKEDPFDPFTLQGTTEKQFSIEELEGTKIVKRRPGVSVKTCIKIAPTAQTGGTGRLEAPEDAVCSSAEDRSNVKKACLVSCKSACTESLENYRQSTAAELGLPPSKKALERPARRCSRSCAYECQKEGSGYKFTVNFNS